MSTDTSVTRYVVVHNNRPLEYTLAPVPDGSKRAYVDRASGAGPGLTKEAADALWIHYEKRNSLVVRRASLDFLED